MEMIYITATSKTSKHGYRFDFWNSSNNPISFRQRIQILIGFFIKLSKYDPDRYCNIQMECISLNHPQ